jgi:hypothetical protein
MLLQNNTTIKTWLALPERVPPNCYRFFCKELRTDILQRTTTLLIDDIEVTLPSSAVNVGLIGGKLCCDVKELFAKTNNLI